VLSGHLRQQVAIGLAQVVDAALLRVGEQVGGAVDPGVRLLNLPATARR
jgi:hypothetical protein